MARYIQYSNDHLHVIEEDDGLVETCYLSRNWNRCTAGKNHSLDEADGECEVNVTAYYDGDEWRWWTGDFRESFARRVEGEDGVSYLQLPDGTLI